MSPPQVNVTMPLHVLAYNMKRVMTIIGVPELIEAIGRFLALCWAILARPAHWVAMGPPGPRLKEN